MISQGDVSIWLLLPCPERNEEISPNKPFPTVSFKGIARFIPDTLAHSLPSTSKLAWIESGAKGNSPLARARKTHAHFNSRQLGGSRPNSAQHGQFASQYAVLLLFLGFQLCATRVCYNSSLPAGHVPGATERFFSRHLGPVLAETPQSDYRRVFEEFPAFEKEKPGPEKERHHGPAPTIMSFCVDTPRQGF